MRLRRSIGLKKDEYILDKKHITCALALPWLVAHLRSMSRMLLACNDALLNKP